MDALSYHGPDLVNIGDESTLSIPHSSSTHLHSLTGKFILTNLLHVLAIFKNLLFVLHFYIDNDVYFKFYSNFFLVKDFHS